MSSASITRWRRSAALARTSIRGSSGGQTQSGLVPGRRMHASEERPTANRRPRAIPPRISGVGHLEVCGVPRLMCACGRLKTCARRSARLVPTTGRNKEIASRPSCSPRRTVPREGKEPARGGLRSNQLSRGDIRPRRRDHNRHRKVRSVAGPPSSGAPDWLL